MVSKIWELTADSTLWTLESDHWTFGPKNYKTFIRLQYISYIFKDTTSPN